MDRAQIVIAARGRKSERELGVLDESFRPEALAWSYHGMGHGLIVDPGHGGAGRDGDFARREGVVVHAYGCHRIGARTIRILRETRGGDESGEHDGQVQSAQNALRSEEHTSELQSQSDLVCRLLLE